MKKLGVILAVFLLLLVMVTYPAAAVETFILVYDAPGEYQGQPQQGESGFAICGESLYDWGKLVTVGYGLEVPAHTIKAPDIFGFVPVFGVLKFEPFPTVFPMDLSLRVGYSFLTGDHDYADTAKLIGGKYYGYGLGYYLNRDPEEGSFTKVELLFSESNGTHTLGGISDELKYSRYSLLISFGYEGL